MIFRWTAAVSLCSALALGSICYAQGAQSSDVAGGTSGAGKGNSMSSKDTGGQTGRSTGSVGSAGGTAGTTGSATDKAGSTPARGSEGTGIKGRANGPGGAGR